MSEVTTLVTAVLGVFALALGARLFVRGHERLSFASVLVVVGVAVAVLGVSFELPLTSEVILAVLLPTIVFQGTLTLDVRRLGRNAPLVVALAVVGLPVSVVLLGWVGTRAFGFPLLVSLLFAAIILPTDPAAVLSLFEQFDVAERLAVTIEGESLLNDGVAIVIFTTLLGAFDSATVSVDTLATPAGLVDVAGDIALAGVGGLVLGGAVGYVAHAVVRRLGDDMAVLLLTVLVAYGSFLVAEHYLGLSGVLAVVGAGLAMGAHEETHEAMRTSESHVQQLWTTAAFLVTTVLYVLIGAEVSPTAFLEHAEFVVAAAVLVVVVRAVTVYAVVTAANVGLGRPVPRYCQHIMVWGGLHTVVPVALVLSLPASLPFAETLQVMVFGVAIISIVVQGLLMPAVLERTGLA
jgi:CPA1 family monovalent cation:H+ antiporter